MPLKGKTAFLALLIFAALPANSLSADEAPKRTISLSASGAIKTTPDKVDISTGVNAQAPTAKEALVKNSAAMTEVIAALKGEGLDAKDIQTTNFNVQPLYEERKDGRPPKIVGYQVTNSVRITVRDVGKLGQILDRVVTLGVNDARKLAMRNAIANAKLYAEAAGAKLGKVLAISEDQGIIVARSMAPAPMEMAAKAVPIEAGTATVEARVSVTFELE